MHRARRIDIEEEKRKNTRIAIAIAAFGIACGVFLYISMFALMFASPFVFFRLIPFPSFHAEAFNLRGNIILLTEEVDFSGATYSSPPKEKVLMRSFDGRALSEPTEVEPYSSLDVHDGKAYFFSEGRYRVFDGTEWEEHENPEIGAHPKATVGPEGIWVMSEAEGRASLKRIGDTSVREFPLPFRQGESGSRYCSWRPRLVWAEGGLNLFCMDKETLVHRRLRGAAWQTEGRFGSPDSFRAEETGGDLLLFTREVGEGLEMRSYDSGRWTEPRGLGVGADEFDIGFAVSEYDGRLAVVMQGLFSEKLYLVDEEGVGEAVSLRSPLELKFTFRMLSLIAGPLAAFTLVIFILSAVVDRYKLAYWPLRRGRVRFASIFRRFLAHTADSILISLPVAVLGYVVFKADFPSGDPFMLFGIMVLGLGGFLLWVFLYYSLFEGLWGRTPGKWICGIMVLRDNFVRCGLGRAFLRNLLRIVDAMFYYFVAVVTVGATLKWQRLGDVAAGTVVVRARRRKKR